MLPPQKSPGSAAQKPPTPCPVGLILRFHHVGSTDEIISHQPPIRSLASLPPQGSEDGRSELLETSPVLRAHLVNRAQLSFKGACHELQDKEMAPHFSILAWRIPRTEELVGYSPGGSDTTERLGTSPSRASQVALVRKHLPASAGDMRDVGLIPGFRRSPRRAWWPTPGFLPGKSDGQRSWWAIVHGATKSRTRLSDLAHMHTSPFKALK